MAVSLQSRDGVPMSKKERYLFIDIAKGLGIFMVILGHLLSTDQVLRYFLYTIHIPLFLLLSGFFERKRFHCGSYIFTIFKRLYVPYALIVMIDFTAYTIIYRPSVIHVTIPHMLRALVGLDLVYDIPIWFLFCLFIVKVLFQVFNMVRHVKLKVVFLVVVLMCGIVYMYLTEYIGFIGNRYYAVYAIPPVLTYYIIGYNSKGIIKYPFKCFTGDNLFEKALLMLLSFCCLIATFVTSWINGDVGVLGCHFGNVFLFMLGSLTGSYGIIILVSFLASLKRKPRLISYFGEHSLAVQVTHFYLVDYLAPFILTSIEMISLRYDPVTEIILFGLTVIICLIMLLVKGGFAKIFKRSKTPEPQKAA